MARGVNCALLYFQNVTICNSLLPCHLNKILLLLLLLQDRQGPGQIRLVQLTASSYCVFSRINHPSPSHPIPICLLVLMNLLVNCSPKGTVLPEDNLIENILYLIKIPPPRLQGVSVMKGFVIINLFLVRNKFTPRH